MSENTAPVTTPDETTDESLEDFDAFWSTQTRKRLRIKVMGDVVELPPSLPLAFEMEAKRVERSKRDEDVRKLLALLNFPEDAMERWAQAGMDLEQFQVLLAYAPARIAGKNVTLAEVRDMVAGEGKGKPRAKRKH